jgi:CRISPR system Cascade subunit CasB
MTTTQTSSRPSLERETKFLQAIRDRIKHDNGAKADFKRALSGEPKHIRKIHIYVLPYIGKLRDSEREQKRQEEQIWIPVACLSVFYPQPFREGEKQRNFGHSCRSLAAATNSKGAERRFRALLDLTLSDIQSPLTALVRQMKTKEVAIDYPQLIADLRRWEHPDQYIQDQWARTFWGVSALPEEHQSDQNAEDSAQLSSTI